MNTYNLGFITSDDIYNHVKDTISKYRFQMNLKDFNKNLIDPIKLTFDSKVYGKSIEEIIENEILRQIDKSNTNHIGYFHQNIFKYMGSDWEVPEEGFDVINEDKHLFVEMKNKHNTMNSASAQKTYIKMQSKILEDDQAICMLVEVIAKNSQDIDWKITLDKKPYKNNRIRRVSIDKFYEIVTGDKDAFRKLCQILPTIIEDIVKDQTERTTENTVFGELETIDKDILNSLYLLSFNKYEGFDSFHVGNTVGLVEPKK